MVAGDGGLEGGDFIAGDITGGVLAVFPDLVIVVGTLGALAQNADFAPLHGLDWGHLTQERLRGVGNIQGASCIVNYTFCPKKKRSSAPVWNSILRPVIKVQKVDRPTNRSYYLNLPVVLAEALDLSKGEE